MRQEKKIYSKNLGIDLNSKKESELFKWFLACLLFGKPIQQEVARRAYFGFIKEGLTSPEAILNAGWDKLVKALDEAHYVRYDFSTATKLLEVCKELKEKYDGEITNILKRSKDGKDLKNRLLEIKHIGPKTTEIFLRDLKK
ncbi:MAG: DNA methylase [bacterium]|nr:DNA methylase [bacterium]